MAIYITNLRNISNVNAEAKFAIIRSYRRPIFGVQQLAALSPTTELFHKYLRLRDAGQWNARAFATEYVPDFIRDTICSDAAKYAIDNLVKMRQLNINIALGCVCDNETICHRTIVGGILEGYGLDVIYDSGRSYRFYNDLLLDYK